jgi:pyrrolidone-carboxylate peptidase
VIALERFALNIRDYRIKDNSGSMITGQKIHTNAPEAIRTKAPIEETLKYLHSQKFPAEISNFCGTFICNEIYFRALHYINKSKLPHLVSFVHVPLPRNYNKIIVRDGSKKLLPLAKKKDNQLAAMSKVVRAIVVFNCQFLLKGRKK